MNSSQLWKSFDNHFQTVVDDLSYARNDGNIELSRCHKRIKEILEYNVPHGKRTRGLTLLTAFFSLKDGKVSPEELNIAMSIGWAVEIMQACALVADDIVDHSETRRGQLCWYRRKGVGTQAVNDSMLLESCIFVLLRKYCRNLSCYADLLDLFHKVIFNAEMGQTLDMLSSQTLHTDFSLFTEERYSAIVKHKTSYYSFYAPIGIALYLSGTSSPEIHDQVCDILLKIGNLFQVQDDYLDVFGDPAVTGKIGTDIEDNKCSWLIVKACELANSEQLETLKKCFGKKDQTKVASVRQMYIDLKLPMLYSKYGIDAYEEICADIDQFVNPNIPKSIFINLLEKIHKRVK